MSKQPLTEKEKRQLQFLAQLLGAVQQVFDKESEFYVGELNDGNITDFIHVLANGVPNEVYNNITGGNEDHLGFNHIANRLCFQNGKLKD